MVFWIKLLFYMFLFAYDMEIQVHRFVPICISFPNVLGYLFFCAFGVGTFGGSGLGIGLCVWGLGFGVYSHFVWE